MGVTAANHARLMRTTLLAKHPAYRGFLTAANADTVNDQPMTTTSAPNEELLRTDEVAARLRVSRRTVWRMIARGELEATRLRAGWRIRADELNERLRVYPGARPTTNRGVH